MSSSPASRHGWSVTGAVPMGGTVSLLTFPDLGLAIAAAANVTDASGVNPFALQVAEAFTRRRSE